MLIPIVTLIIALITLTISADKMIESAESIAKEFNVSPFMIGLTIVAFGTSAPEIVISFNAVLSGSQNLAIGNALGSNICNIGIVLGATLILAGKLSIPNNIYQVELPLYILATLFASYALFDAHFSFIEGIILLLFVVVFIVSMLFKQSKQKTNDHAVTTSNQSNTKSTTTEDNSTEHTLNETTISKTQKYKPWLFFIMYLSLLLVSAKLMVWGAIEIAHILNISETIIGLTIVAIGTSLPELAASLAAAFKKNHDMVIGNILGSNIFNIITVLPLPALLAPGNIDSNIADRDLSSFLVLSFVFITLLIINKKRASIHRGFAIACILPYASYSYLLIAK